MTAEEKARIDGMSHFQLCRHWRFSATGDPLTSGDTGEYFMKVLFKDHGGFTPSISEALGWDLTPEIARAVGREEP
jgi:hypothetical protein